MNWVKNVLMWIWLDRFAKSRDMPLKKQHVHVSRERESILCLRAAREKVGGQSIFAGQSLVFVSWEEEESKRLEVGPKVCGPSFSRSPKNSPATDTPLGLDSLLNWIWWSLAAHSRWRSCVQKRRKIFFFFLCFFLKKRYTQWRHMNKVQSNFIVFYFLFKGFV